MLQKAHFFFPKMHTHPNTNRHLDAHSKQDVGAPGFLFSLSGIPMKLVQASKPHRRSAGHRSLWLSTVVRYVTVGLHACVQALGQTCLYVPYFLLCGSLLTATPPCPRHRADDAHVSVLNWHQMNSVRSNPFFFETVW